MVQTLVHAIVLCLAAHMFGDYFIQNDWMALEKTNRWWPAIVHGVTYTVPFVPVVLVMQPTGHAAFGLLPIPAIIYALAVIGGTHIVIDRFYLAKHVIWARNQLAPFPYRPPHTATGFGEDRPAWLAVWLMIIVDNCIHMAINTAAVVWL